MVKSDNRTADGNPTSVGISCAIVKYFDKPWHVFNGVRIDFLWNMGEIGHAD
jgi:hypothetical protein